MKHIIEITWLTNKMDSAWQHVHWILIAYKGSDGKSAAMEWNTSTMEVMKTLGINDYSEVYWKKYEIDIADDGKLRSVNPIDTRVYSFKDFDRLESKISQILSLLSKQTESETPKID